MRASPLVLNPTAPATPNAPKALEDWILMTTRAKTLAGVAVLALALAAWFLTRGEEAHTPDATSPAHVATEAPAAPIPNAASAGEASLARTGVAEAPRPEASAANSTEPVAATPVTPATTVHGRIHGRVWNPKGEPAVGRPVRILGTPRGPVKTVVTDVEGRFDERELGPGKYHVSTQPEAAELKALGLSGQYAALESLAQVSVQLEAGEEIELDLGAPPKDPIRVHGRLTGFDPSPEALLQWVPEGEDGYNRARYVSTRDGGKFELLLADAGRYRISALVQPDSIRCDHAVDVPRAEAWEHDIALPRGELLLRVVARDDRPVKNAQVELTPRAGIAPIPFMSATPFARRTDAEGRVRVGTLRAGRWAVAVHDASLSKEEPLAAAATSVTVVEGGPAPAEIVIVLEPGVASAGRVVDEAGQRIYFANVFVFDADGEPLNPLFGATTNKQGEYTLTALRPGRYAIVAAHGDRWSDIVELAVPDRAPAEAPELVLRAAAVLEVAFGDAEPAWIDVRDAGGRCLSAVLDRNLFTGGFGRGCSTRSWSGWLPRGNYEVTARTRSGAGASRRVALIAGERTAADLKP